MSTIVSTKTADRIISFNPETSDFRIQTSSGKDIFIGNLAYKFKELLVDSEWYSIDVDISRKDLFSDSSFEAFRDLVEEHGHPYHLNQVRHIGSALGIDQNLLPKFTEGSWYVIRGKVIDLPEHDAELLSKANPRQVEQALAAVSTDLVQDQLTLDGKYTEDAKGYLNLINDYKADGGWLQNAKKHGISEDYLEKAKAFANEAFDKSGNVKLAEVIDNKELSDTVKEIVASQTDAEQALSTVGTRALATLTRLGLSSVGLSILIPVVATASSFVVQGLQGKGIFKGLAISEKGNRRAARAYHDQAKATTNKKKKAKLEAKHKKALQKADDRLKKQIKKLKAKGNTEQAKELEKRLGTFSHLTKRLKALHL